MESNPKSLNCLSFVDLLFVCPPKDLALFAWICIPPRSIEANETTPMVEWKNSGLKKKGVKSSGLKKRGVKSWEYKGDLQNIMAMRCCSHITHWVSSCCQIFQLQSSLEVRIISIIVIIIVIVMITNIFNTATYYWHVHSHCHQNPLSTIFYHQLQRK